MQEKKNPDSPQTNNDDFLVAVKVYLKQMILYSTKKKDSF